MQDEWHGFFRNLQEDKGEGGGTSRKAYETPNSVYDSFRSCFKQTIKVFFPRQCRNLNTSWALGDIKKKTVNFVR